MSFNPRLRTGGDLRLRGRLRSWRCFNPRLRTGGDAYLTHATDLIHQMFQSAPPHGRRLERVGEIGRGRRVSIRASAREATRAGGSRQGGRRRVSIRASAREATPGSAACAAEAQAFQSAPPHGRRRPARRRTGRAWRVSIRASAREATTRTRHPCVRPRSVSIRASAREATRLTTIFHTQTTVSIRASAREATCRALRGAVAVPVSIRASAREATHHRRLQRGRAFCFNPRLRTGGDPRGSRARRAAAHRFNPRLRTGGDARWCRPVASRMRFQSAPPHGRRHQLRIRHDAVVVVSIRASAREATRHARARCAGAQVSIRASAREATTVLAMHSTVSLFQSAPPHGRRHAAEPEPALSSVSIRASAREATSASR